MILHRGVQDNAVELSMETFLSFYDFPCDSYLTDKSVLFFLPQI